MELAGSDATWTGGPKGAFAGRKHHKPRLALNNITAGVREREDANRTRVAGHLDEIQGVVAITLNAFRNGVVGFIDWLGLSPPKSNRNSYDERRRWIVRIAVRAHHIWLKSPPAECVCSGRIENGVSSTALHLHGRHSASLKLNL
jgi:hypothetical protein